MEDTQILRIKHYEEILRTVEGLLSAEETAEEDLAGLRGGIRELEAYYGSPEWKQDFADDEAGRLPGDLARGVLSEDGIYNVLESFRERTEGSGRRSGMKRIAVDIGGTSLRTAVFDEEMKILDVFKVPNDRTLGAAGNLDKLVGFLKSRDYAYCGVGIASPGPLDLKRGMMLNPPNLFGWDNFPVADFLAERMGVPAAVNNDGNLAGLAEARIGAGKGFDSVVFLGMSTGMGGSFVYKGELINGAHCNTAEFYNVIVSDDPYHHGSANPGSLNELAGGAAMERIATERFGRQMFAKDLFALYDEGNEDAADILEKTSEMLARGIANIYYMIDPDVYVIGGSIGLHNRWYVAKALEKAKRYMVMPDINVAWSVFGDDAGLYGAALLAGDAAGLKG